MHAFLSFDLLWFLMFCNSSIMSFIARRLSSPKINNWCINISALGDNNYGEKGISLSFRLLIHVLCNRFQSHMNYESKSIINVSLMQLVNLNSKGKRNHECTLSFWQISTVLACYRRSSRIRSSLPFIPSWSNRIHISW